MKKFQIPFFISREIDSYELPAMEKRGCVAQIVPNLDFVTVRFYESKTEIIQLNGLPHPFDSDVSDLRSGLSETVAVGCPDVHRLIIFLIDLIAVDGKSVSSLPFSERHSALYRILKMMDKNAMLVFPLASYCSEALVAQYEKMEPGTGMIVRSLSNESVFALRKSEDK